MPFADYLKKRCPTCSANMRPLANSLFCPNDCDRAPKTFIESEKTEPIRRKCPKCSSPDIVTRAFWGGTYHSCVDCKHGWS